MQKKIISSVLTLTFLGIGLNNVAQAQIQQGNGIVYQNTNQAVVNTTPQTPPLGINAVPNQPQQTTSINERGQTVVTTTEVQKLNQTNNGVTKAVDYSSMDQTQKFWNVPNNTIRQVRERYEDKDRVINQDLRPARCDNRRGVVNITGNPGNDFPLIRLDGRNVSTVLMTDIYGKPWPIDYIVYQDKELNIIKDDKDPNVSSFSINALTNYAQGNFVVKLAEYPVPIVFTFTSSQREVDCLVVAKLDQPSPNTDVKTETLSAAAMDNSLNSTLYGVTPKGGRSLKVSDNSAMVWLLEDGNVVIRTRYKIIAPAPISQSRSPDGTMVYKVQYSPSYTYRYNDVINSFTVTR